jgi:hypothetical protein
MPDNGHAMTRRRELGFVDCRSHAGDPVISDGLFEIREPAWRPAPLRAVIEAEIERLIAFLDHVDGDPDLEDTHDAEQPCGGC